MKNQSGDLSWTEGELTFIETVRQEYTNCVFSAGRVEGHPVDTLYLKLERDGVTDTFLLIRADEASALIWCLSGTLWSQQIEDVPEDRHVETH